VHEIEIDVPDKEFWAFVAKYDGLPYSQYNIVGLSIVIILKKIGIPSRRNPFRDGDKAMFCSELVAALLHCQQKEILVPEDILTLLRQ
jgi:hypothetical protein